MVEHVVLEQDLVDHVLGRADEVRTVKGGARRVLVQGHRRPAAFLADRVHHRGHVGERFLDRLLGGFRDVAVGVDADRGNGIEPGLARRVVVEFGEGREPLGQAPDDGDRHRQAQRAGAERRFRCAAHGDPDRQRILHGAGIDAHPAVQRRTMPARPREAFVLTERDQQLQLLLEQLVVVVEVVAEQRERLREGAAARHDLGASARQEVERREVLEHPDRVIGADHAHRAGEPDAFGALRCGGQHHRGRGHDQVRPVMFTDAEDVQAELVGELDLLQQVPHPLLGTDRLPGLRVGVELREGVEADLHVHTDAPTPASRLRAPLGDISIPGYPQPLKLEPTCGYRF